MNRKAGLDLLGTVEDLAEVRTVFPLELPAKLRAEQRKSLQALYERINKHTASPLFWEGSSSRIAAVLLGQLKVGNLLDRDRRVQASQLVAFFKEYSQEQVRQVLESIQAGRLAVLRLKAGDLSLCSQMMGLTPAQGHLLQQLKGASEDKRWQSWLIKLLGEVNLDCRWKDWLVGEVKVDPAALLKDYLAKEDFCSLAKLSLMLDTKFQTLSLYFPKISRSGKNATSVKCLAAFCQFQQFLQRLILNQEWLGRTLQLLAGEELAPGLLLRLLRFIKAKGKGFELQEGLVQSSLAAQLCHPHSLAVLRRQLLAQPTSLSGRVLRQVLKSQKEGERVAAQILSQWCSPYFEWYIFDKKSKEYGLQCHRATEYLLSEFLFPAIDESVRGERMAADVLRQLGSNFLAGLYLQLYQRHCQKEQAITQLSARFQSSRSKVRQYLGLPFCYLLAGNSVVCQNPVDNLFGACCVLASCLLRNDVQLRVEFIGQLREFIERQQLRQVAGMLRLFRVAEVAAPAFVFSRIWDLVDSEECTVSEDCEDQLQRLRLQNERRLALQQQKRIMVQEANQLLLRGCHSLKGQFSAEQYLGNFRAKCYYLYTQMPQRFSWEWLRIESTFARLTGTSDPAHRAELLVREAQTKPTAARLAELEVLLPALRDCGEAQALLEEMLPQCFEKCFDEEHFLLVRRVLLCLRIVLPRRKPSHLTIELLIRHLVAAPHKKLLLELETKVLCCLILEQCVVRIADLPAWPENYLQYLKVLDSEFELHRLIVFRHLLVLCARSQQACLFSILALGVQDPSQAVARVCRQFLRLAFKGIAKLEQSDSNKFYRGLYDQVLFLFYKGRRTSTELTKAAKLLFGLKKVIPDLFYLYSESEPDRSKDSWLQAAKCELRELSRRYCKERTRGERPSEVLQRSLYFR